MIGHQLMCKVLTRCFTKLQRCNIAMLINAVPVFASKFTKCNVNLIAHKYWYTMAQIHDYSLVLMYQIDTLIAYDYKCTAFTDITLTSLKEFDQDVPYFIVQFIVIVHC